MHYEPELKCWLGFRIGGKTTHIHDFCLSLEFLGIKDFNFFSKAITKATAKFIEISYIFYRKRTISTQEFGRSKEFDPQGQKAKKADIRPNIVVSQNLIPIGLQGTLKDLLACWETIARPLKIRKSNLESFGLMLAFLFFMALRLKLLRSAEFLCQNGPHKAKKLQNFNKCSCGLVCGL